MARKPASSPAQALDGLPVWAKTISVVGAPTAAAAALIYGLYVYLPKIDAELRTMESGAAAMHEAYKTHLADETRQNERMIAVLQRICLGASKDDADRIACVSVSSIK
jgi:hypothetical protein